MCFVHQPDLSCFSFFRFFCLSFYFILQFLSSFGISSLFLFRIQYMNEYLTTRSGVKTFLFVNC